MTQFKFSFKNGAQSKLALASKALLFEKFHQDLNEAQKTKDKKNYLAANIEHELTVNHEPLPPEMLERIKAKLTGQKSESLVFVNGRFEKALSHISKIEVTPKAATVSSSFIDQQHFTYLNVALCAESLVISCPKGMTIDLDIYYFFAPKNTAVDAYFPNLEILLADSSIVNLCEHFQNCDETQDFLCNSLVVIKQERGSFLRHFLKQDLAKNAYFLRQSKVEIQSNACYQAFSSQLGGKLCHYHLEVDLLAHEAKCALFGISLPIENQRFSQLINCQHLAPKGQSNQLYKAIVADEATNDFRGLILIANNGQKSQAKQLSKNLLLSEKAKATAIPGLKIDVDDVKCYHGATVSDLREEEIFYLTSRGINKDKARQLLAKAFVYDVALSIEDLLLRRRSQDHLDEVFRKRMIIHE